MEGSSRISRCRLLMLAVSITGTAILVRMELPPDHRTMLALEARMRIGKWLHRVAHRAGHAGMGSELSGWVHSPRRQGYGVAYRLARARDRLT